VGNRQPTWIGTGGRHQSECKADIVGLVGKNEVDRFDPASDKRAHRIGVGINQAFRRSVHLLVGREESFEAPG
jgi:hypothetical protein